jgi:glycerol uptake facilitator protein
MRRPCLMGEMLGEVVGSFLLVLFGTGSVAVAVLTGAHQGLWQVATVWGFAIGLTIYSVGAVSGAHLNPAVTLPMAIFRPALFSWRKVVPYISAQMVGGVLASLLLLGLYGATCAHFEATKGIVRGAPGSQLSAMWFGEYFPNPGVYGTDAAAFAQVPALTGFLGEMVGTALLVFFIMALTDKCNKLAPIAGNLHPFLIGFVVAVIISIEAPLTQAGLNPMRDFAPRLVSYFAGWGKIAIPGPRGCEWWLYILAPLVGGVLGGGVYRLLVQPYQAGERVAAGGDPRECSLYGCGPSPLRRRGGMVGGIAIGMGEATPVTVRVFVDNPQQPSAVAQTALSRVQAAASRLAGVSVEVLGLNSDEAIVAGAAVEPTVVVEDLVIATGQAPAAGHVIRAVAAIRGEMG